MAFILDLQGLHEESESIIESLFCSHWSSRTCM